MYIIYLEMSIKLKLKNLINFENSSYSHRDLKKNGIYHPIIIVHYSCFNNNLWICIDLIIFGSSNDKVFSPLIRLVNYSSKKQFQLTLHLEWYKTHNQDSAHTYIQNDYSILHVIGSNNLIGWYKSLNFFSKFKIKGKKIKI